MITDKEELLSKMFRAVREVGYITDPLRLTEESHDACIDLIKQYEIRIRAESAEQARKEAAESAVKVLCNHCKTPQGQSKCDNQGRMCEYANELRAAILSSPVKEGKTDAEKLAIAVRALEKISGRGMTGGGIAKRALKEIQ